MDDADALYILFWRILLHYRRGKEGYEARDYRLTVPR